MPSACVKWPRNIAFILFYLFLYIAVPLKTNFVVGGFRGWQCSETKASKIFCVGVNVQIRNSRGKNGEALGFEALDLFKDLLWLVQPVSIAIHRCNAAVLWELLYQARYRIWFFFSRLRKLGQAPIFVLGIVPNDVTKICTKVFGLSIHDLF